MPNADPGRWSVIQQSTLGPKHAQRELANQDAVAVYHPYPPTLPIALAVADGHGSARYIRSSQGSKIAAEAAIQLLAELELSSREATLSDIKRATTEQLPRKLHLTWRARVLDHLAAHPLSEADRAHLHSSGARERDLQNRPEFMYGTTLLASLVTSSYVIFVQIGDGDLMVAWPSGQASTAFAADELHLGDQTHSLASTNAWHHVQVQFQSLINEFPLLVLAATDGYAKAFHTQADFTQVATDLIHLVMTHGTAEVEANLGAWVEEAAELSGDDATVAIALQVIEPVGAHGQADGDAAAPPDEAAVEPMPDQPSSGSADPPAIDALAPEQIETSAAATDPTGDASEPTAAEAKAPNEVTQAESPQSEPER